MTNSVATQLSLIAESDFTHRPIGDWEYDELGTDNFLKPKAYGLELGTEDLLVPNFPDQKLGTEILLVPNYPDQKLGTNNFLVPNSHNSELGTNNFLVPNSHHTELGTDNFLVPNSYKWQPPIGNLEQKPIKDRQYWYWRYYDNRGKKASLYLARDYNKAVRKAMKIGIPPNAKQNQSTLLQTDPQTSSQQSGNLIDIASTARAA